MKKILIGAPSGIKSPLGTGTAGNFFPIMGNGARTRGRNLIGDGDGDYAPRPQPTSLSSLFTSRWAKMGLFFLFFSHCYKQAYQIITIVK